MRHHFYHHVYHERGQEQIVRDPQERLEARAWVVEQDVQSDQYGGDDDADQNQVVEDLVLHHAQCAEPELIVQAEIRNNCC